MSAFLSVDVEACRQRQHRFVAAWSDKTPMKVSLICLTCSEASGKSAYAAYGDPMKSWGQWMQKRNTYASERPEPNLLSEEEL